MKGLNFRTLYADEIECRVGNTFASSNSCSLLMYKNARVDMALLDEVVGPLNWQRTHNVVNGNLFCTVSILDGDGRWVSKEDVGTESNTEKEKGEASDAFKRACVNWGIGRELYTCPNVIVELAANEWQEKNGKKIPKLYGWHVSEIEYDDNRKVKKLVIVDSKGNQRWPKVYGAPSVQPTVKKVSVAELKAKVQAAKTADEVAKIWKNNKEYQTDAEFKNLVKERGTELKQQV